MNLYSLKTLPLAAVLCVSVSACRKSFDDSAGKGGNATLQTTLAHHNISKNIVAATVYIKYNTSDAPGDNVYDDSAICTYVNNTPTAIFTTLKKGNYYLYAKGYDTSVARNVTGGSKYTVPDNSILTYTLAMIVGDGD